LERIKKKRKIALKNNNKQAAIDAVLVNVWIGRNLLPNFYLFGTKVVLRHEIDVLK
jgi:hypothetical protein